MKIVWIVVPVFAACTAGADIEDIDVDDVARANVGRVWDTKEILDGGDDPKEFGCLAVYDSMNASCSTVKDTWGDSCIDDKKLKERTQPKDCRNDENPVAPKEYDCTVVLDSPKARCVEKDDVCLPGNFLTGKKSARCELPPMCNCPVQSGDTILENNCPDTDINACSGHGTCRVRRADNTTASYACEYPPGYPQGGGGGNPIGAVGAGEDGDTATGTIEVELEQIQP
jgi:hypothetical protein